MGTLFHAITRAHTRTVKNEALSQRCVAPVLGVAGWVVKVLVAVSL
jgi:hypothetical protein